MVEHIRSTSSDSVFPETAPAAYPVFFRTYSRSTPEGRESWDQVCDRTLKGLVKLGQLTPEEADLINQQQRSLKCLTSGRWLWIGGTPWIEAQENFSGGYNCTSTNVTDWRAFGLMMNLAMMGCGTGAVLEPHYIEQLPPIRNEIEVTIASPVGTVSAEQRQSETIVTIDGHQVQIVVGDSRQGWVDSYQAILELSSDPRFNEPIVVEVNLGNVRPTGEGLKGFGGVSNPVKLPDLYQRCTAILNKAIGRQLNSVECCLLIDEAAITIVAGNIRRSAGIRQFAADDLLGSTAKDNLWQQDENGNWRIDPDRDSLRMANHTRVFHHKPTAQDLIDAVRKQFYSGEGAIQYAPEAIVRANADLFPYPELRQEFLELYTSLGREEAKGWIRQHHPEMPENELEHRVQRYGLNPCVTADTWVHTGDGPQQVKDLIGVQHSTYVNGELFSTTPQGFFFTGIKPVVKLETQEGFSLRLTPNHRLLKVTAQTQKKQYSEWVETKDLQPGDRILIHNHRDLTPWEGNGTWEEGWLLGNLVGDGCFSVNTKSYAYHAKLRYWGETQTEMSEHALTLLRKAVDCPTTAMGFYHAQNQYYELGSAGLAQLANQYGLAQHHKMITNAIEQSSYQFYRGFLRGLFDADGSVQGTHLKGVSVRLAQSDLPLLEAAQRMLLRLGIMSRIYQNRRPEGVHLMPDSNRALAPYVCKANHELVIANDNLLGFQTLIGFQDSAKAERLQELLSGYQRKLNRERFAVTIASVTCDGEEPVYDCTVPGPHQFDANGFVAHNCGEIIGSNFHCVSGDTLLITKDGMHKIKDVVECDIEIWNGKNWSQVQPFKTGSSRVLYRVRFADGTYLDATEYHRFFVKDRFGKNYQEVQTKDLMNTSNYAIHTEPFTIHYEDGLDIDLSYAYTLGVAVGDGTTDQKNQAEIRLYKEKVALSLAGNKSSLREYGYLPTFTEVTEVTEVTDLGFSGEFLKSLKNNPEALNVIAGWKRQAILHFIAGLADTDGSNTSSNGIRIYISDYDRAYRVQLLLTKCGIRSSLNLCAHKGSVTNYGIRNRDLYYLQITECGNIPCQRLDVSKGKPAKYKPAKYKGKRQVVKSVEQLPGLHDTYCFNEPEYHKGVFGNTLTGNCNLAEIHLNQIDPTDYTAQENAFRAGALSVAVLLNHQFQEPRYQQSRLWDPIVGVSFTGLFDFFVHAFGVEWLRWWCEGRPDTDLGKTFKDKEANYLNTWREIVEQTVGVYCDRHGIKRPNRCTTVQPAGTKSLLTGSSPGWHPPKAQRFIRRITFRKNDAVALACLDYGYSIIPSQSDKDEQGNLLNDPFDPRCTEWLVEIPTAVSWANLPGADQVDISQFSALAQFDFYMQVQRHYTRHNTSATIELREAEVEPLAQAIYQSITNGDGYMSAALLARFDDHQTFPRLPFEPIAKEEYDRLQGEVLARRKTSDFFTALQRYDAPNLGLLEEAGPAGCDSDKCLLPDLKT